MEAARQIGEVPWELLAKYGTLLLQPVFELVAATPHRGVALRWFKSCQQQYKKTETKLLRSFYGAASQI